MTLTTFDWIIVVVSIVVSFVPAIVLAMAVCFYARLWRRSNVLTDLEFYEIRYSGKAATFMRGFRGVYLGLFFNLVIMASVNLAAAYFALKQPEVGGLAGLIAKVPAQSLHLLPDFSDWGQTLSVLIIPLTVQWWSVWYPAALFGAGSWLYGNTAQALVWMVALLASGAGLAVLLPRIWRSSAEPATKKA